MSKKNFLNRCNIEGTLYEHSLELKITGEKSKNPGTPFISGEVKIATDDAMVNIVSVYFTYVTATTSKGNPNATFNTLNDIINGTIGNVMAHGADKAGKLRISTAIGLNEFYSDRSGKEELVSTKRNEGGFVHLVNEVNSDPGARDTFDVDMIVTSTRTIEADEEKNLPEKLILKGAIFDFRNALLPVEFSVLNPRAIAYFESMEISNTNPLCTRLQGHQVSEVVEVTKTEEGAWGEPIVKKYSNTRKDYVVTWAASDPYEWDSEEFITAVDLKKAMAEREVALADMKKRNDEYKASRNGGAMAPAAAPSNGFNF